MKNVMFAFTLLLLLSINAYSDDRTGTLSTKNFLGGKI